MCLCFKLVNFLRYVKKDARISLAGTDLVVANITQEVDMITILCMLMIITINSVIITIGVITIITNLTNITILCMIMIISGGITIIMIKTLGSTTTNLTLSIII